MIIEILKILFSKSVKESLIELNDLRKISKSWKKSLKISEGKFDRNNKHEATLILSDSMHHLKELGWSKNELINARFVFWEIYENALRHSKKNESIIIKIHSSASFWKLDIIDKGEGFNLHKELKKQGAFIYSSKKKLRGLGLVCRISPQIENKILKNGHKVSLVIFKGQGKISINKIEDITIFELIGNAFESPYYWNMFIKKFKELTTESKILISFVPVNQNEFNQYLNHMSAPTMIFHDFRNIINSNKNKKIALLGLKIFSPEIEQFFKDKIKTFDKLDDALIYLNLES